MIERPFLKPDPDCPVCFGTGIQHCGMNDANCRAGTDGAGGNCGQPCSCEYRRPREHWTLIGLVDAAPRQYAYQGPGDQVRLLHIDDFSHLITDYSSVQKIGMVIPFSEEILIGWETNGITALIESSLAFSINRAEDAFMLYGQRTPITDTERALRRLERPIDMTTDRQIRRARRRARWTKHRTRLAERLLPADYFYDREDY